MSKVENLTILDGPGHLLEGKIVVVVEIVVKERKRYFKCTDRFKTNSEFGDFFILFAFFSYQKRWRMNNLPFNECNIYYRFIIYYENFKTFNPIITSNLGCQKFQLGKNNVAYEF